MVSVSRVGDENQLVACIYIDFPKFNRIWLYLCIFSSTQLAPFATGQYTEFRNTRNETIKRNIRYIIFRSIYWLPLIIFSLHSSENIKCCPDTRI